MMAEKSDQDGVMNLSTSKDDENENMANGEIYKNGKLEENAQVFVFLNVKLVLGNTVVFFVINEATIWKNG